MYNYVFLVADALNSGLARTYTGNQLATTYCDMKHSAELPSFQVPRQIRRRCSFSSTN